MQAKVYTVSSSVQQGSVLPPLLFIILLDPTLETVENSHHAGRNITTGTFAYADEVAIVANSEKVLQITLNLWCNTPQELGLRPYALRSVLLASTRQETTDILQREQPFGRCCLSNSLFFLYGKL